MRRSFRCECQREGWSFIPIRIATAPLEHDFAESILRDCEAATGVRPDGCPWAALRDPFVGEVIRAHRWWKAGQLTTRYPRAPSRLLWGIETFDAALNGVQVHDMREDREEREKERRLREMQSGPKPR